MLVAGVFVAIIVQFGGERSGLDCNVTRKYGEVLRTTVALERVVEIPAKTGAAGVGILPPTPLYVTPAVNANALPSNVLLVIITMP